jgi:hypothetical protein
MRCGFCNNETAPNLHFMVEGFDGPMISRTSHQVDDPGPRGSWSLVISFPKDGLMGDEIARRIGRDVKLIVSSTGTTPAGTVVHETGCMRVPDHWGGHCIVPASEQRPGEEGL